MATRVIATDLDGTLFYPKHFFRMISKENEAFLKRWTADGNRVALVSSRSRYYAKKIRERFDFPFDVIGGNGTFIQIDGKVVKEEAFDPTAVRSLLFELQRDYKPFLIIGSSPDYPILQMRTHNHGLANFMYKVYSASQFIYSEECVKSDAVFYHEIEKKHMCKLMVCIGVSPTKQRLAYHLTQIFSRKYPQFQFAWLNQFIEITPKGCDKGSGVSFYLDYLGLEKENVSVIGDSGNDISMFDAFPEHSYCMAHARKEVKIHASHVVSRVCDLEAILYPSADRK